VRVILRANPSEKPRGTRNGPGATNPDIVDVSEYRKKFPPAVVKEFEAGRKAEQRGEMDAAVRLYEAALHEAAGFLPALNSLGVRAPAKGRSAGGGSRIRRVIELNQNGAQAYFNLGNVLFLTNRNGEAKQTLEAGLRLSPSNALGHYLNGSVLRPAGGSKVRGRATKDGAGNWIPRCRKCHLAGHAVSAEWKEHEAAAMLSPF